MDSIASSTCAACRTAASCNSMSPAPPIADSASSIRTTSRFPPPSGICTGSRRSSPVASRRCSSGMQASPTTPTSSPSWTRPGESSWAWFPTWRCSRPDRGPRPTPSGSTSTWRLGIPEPRLSDLQQWMQAVVTGRGTLSAKLQAAESAYRLRAEDVVATSTDVTERKRLEIYASGYVLRLMECLRADFPCLLAWLGPSVFDAFAKAYLVVQPPGSYTLFDLSARFPAFLAATQPASVGQSGSALLDLPVDGSHGAGHGGGAAGPRPRSLMDAPPGGHAGRASRRRS